MAPNKLLALAGGKIETGKIKTCHTQKQMDAPEIFKTIGDQLRAVEDAEAVRISLATSRRFSALELDTHRDESRKDSQRRYSSSRDQMPEYYAQVITYRTPDSRDSRDYLRPRIPKHDRSRTPEQYRYRTPERNKTRTPDQFTPHPPRYPPPTENTQPPYHGPPPPAYHNASVNSHPAWENTSITNLNQHWTVPLKYPQVNNITKPQATIKPQPIQTHHDRNSKTLREPTRDIQISMDHRIGTMDHITGTMEETTVTDKGKHTGHQGHPTTRINESLPNRHQREKTTGAKAAKATGTDLQLQTEELQTHRGNQHFNKSPREEKEKDRPREQAVDAAGQI